MIHISKKAKCALDNLPGYFSLKGLDIEPHIYSKEHLIILNGNRFTLATLDEGIIENSLYLWGGNKIPDIFNIEQKLEKYSGETIVVGNASRNNYYHWVFQVFASLLFCKSYFGERAVRVIGPQLNSFSSQYIELLGDSIEYIEVNEKTFLVAQKAFYSNLMWGEFSSRPIGLIGDLFEQIDIGSEHQTIDRIYISRGDTKFRKVKNEVEVIKLLLRYDFEVVTLTDFSVKEQISLFRNAKFIVAPHGAGLTNCLFSREGTKVVELFQENYLNPCFWSIAEGRRLSYTGIINPVVVNGDDKHLDEMEVDIDLLESFLKSTKGSFK